MGADKNICIVHNMLTVNSDHLKYKLVITITFVYTSVKQNNIAN